MSSDDIQTAFSILDIDKSGQITLPSLKKRLGSLFPGDTIRIEVYYFLMI